MPVSSISTMICWLKFSRLITMVLFFYFLNIVAIFMRMLFLRSVTDTWNVRTHWSNRKKSLSWCEGDWDSRLTIFYAFTSHLNTKTYFHFWFLVNGDKKLYNTYPFFHPYEVYSPPWHSNRTINDTAVFAKIEIRDVFYPQGHLSGSPNTCRIKLVCVRCKVCTRFV